MDKLKNVIESVSSSTAQIPVNEPLKHPLSAGHLNNSGVQNLQEHSKDTENAVPKPPISNIKEVPEEVLKKILEE